MCLFCGLPTLLIVGSVYPPLNTDHTLCPTISPAWVRRGATLGLRLAKTHPQMKLPDFGLNAREAARLSQMKRRDEPLEQEVRGLYILG